MTSDERTREPCFALPGEVCAEDVGFLTGHKPRFKSHNEGRKAKQLCRQVADTLDLVLGDCRDERLQALHVISVVPAPNSSRLLVTVSVELPSAEFDRQEILELLGQQTGRLRGEVAASINRKRVPALAFHVVGPVIPRTSGRIVSHKKKRDLNEFLTASERTMKTTDTYSQVIQKTTGMVHDKAVQRLAQKHGLHVLDVTWEDTARFDFSAVGPNISDMTIQVQHQIPGRDDYELACMPVIRYPNFSDISADISPDEFFVLVGNEKGQPLEKITLRELLGNLPAYLHDPASWKGDRTSLLAGDRDSHVLVSAQACFLPIPKDGIAEFNPVLFNYQSRAGDPAVLTILATREGTSITVIDNVRDGFDAGRTWGQRLFFNQNGERASLTGQRKSDFLAEQQGQQKTAAAADEQADREGLNMVLLIQVPLKQKKPMTYDTLAEFDDMDTGLLQCCVAAPSDVEEAVIGHGKVEGPFTEIDGLDIERDDRYPVRVTVQFYKATSNGVVSKEDMDDIATQINKVYKQADYVGSLVVEGRTGRPTEYAGPHVEPPDWWHVFWQRHFGNTGQSRAEAMQMLHELLGKDWDRATLAQADEAVAEARRKAEV